MVNSNTKEDDPSEKNEGIEPKGMEEGHHIASEEHPYNVIKILVTRRTYIEDKEEDEDDTIANALKKVEKLVGKWMKKDMVKRVVHQVDNNITTKIKNCNSWLSSTKASGRKKKRVKFFFASQTACSLRDLVEDELRCMQR